MKHKAFECNGASTRSRPLRHTHPLLAALFLSFLGAGCSRAQDTSPASTSVPTPSASDTRPLSDAEVKAQYQNCPGGWYSGPRPGKTRFARDPWLWVVTPEFAQRFCMPPEFVSEELKGAEAVAFRLLRKNDEENCGFGGNADACFGETVLRFDVYIKSEIKLPRLHDGTYFQMTNTPSRMLISKSKSEMNARMKYHREHPQPALQFHFEPQQIGLHGVKDGVIAWPIVTLYQQTHFGGVFEGIDYYAFEGSTGFFENPGIRQNNVTRFFINIKRLDRDKRKPMTGQLLNEMAHTIELPQAFTDRIAEADRTRGRNVGAMLNESFRPPGKPQAMPSR